MVKFKIDVVGIWDPKGEVMAMAGKCIELIEGVEMAEAETMKFGIQ